jgi:uncharacterized membrane protein
MEAQIVFVTLLLVIGITGGFYFLFPRISRKGLLFGVYVGEEAYSSEEARQITRSWYWGMTFWLVLSIAVALLAAVMIKPVRAGSIGAVFLLLLGFLIEYLRAYRRAQKLAPCTMPPAAAAQLSMEQPKPLFLPLLALGFALAGGLFALGYALSRYDQLPSLVPTHFGLYGKPDAWKQRSFFTVMLLPLMSLIVGMGMAGTAIFVGFAKRAVRLRDQGISFEAQQRFRRIMANFLAVVSFLVTSMMVLLSVSSIRVALKEAPALPPAFMGLALLMLVIALGGSIFIALRYGQGGSRLEGSAGDAPLTDGLADNRLWVLGMFYVNKDDPSMFVERRFGFGYTINFGNPKAVMFFVGFIGLIILISVIAVLTN